MPSSQELSQDLRQELRLTPQQLLYVRLLEMNSPELDDRVSSELEANPALETSSEDNAVHDTDLTEDGREFAETAADLQKADYANPDDTPSWATQYRKNDRSDFRDYVLPDDTVSFYDELDNQIDMLDLSPDVAAAAKYIAASLDDNGYLPLPLQSIVNSMAFSENLDISMETAREALDVVRHLDPPGLGAINMQEALLLQLERMPKSEVRNNALKIIEEEYKAFSLKHTHKIMSRLRLSNREVADAIALITSLNPKPGSVLGRGGSNVARAIVPDFIINVEDGEITITLNNRFPELRISQGFESAMKELELSAKRRKVKGDSDFIKSHYNEASTFINVLKNRQETLFAVVSAIVKIQREYFLTRDVRKLKPMLIKDIAALTNLDMSVISRATNNKYAQTPWGTLPMRFFFGENLSGNSEGADSTRKGVKEEIVEIVNGEDKKHPLSDEKIFNELENLGYNVQRRTVAKYREELGIPNSRLRKVR